MNLQELIIQIANYSNKQSKEMLFIWSDDLNDKSTCEKAIYYKVYGYIQCMSDNFLIDRNDHFALLAIHNFHEYAHPSIDF